jgi:hypothetical protein
MLCRPRACIRARLAFETQKDGHDHQRAEQVDEQIVDLDLEDAVAHAPLDVGAGEARDPTPQLGQVPDGADQGAAPVGRARGQLDELPRREARALGGVFEVGHGLVQPPGDVARDGEGHDADDLVLVLEVVVERAVGHVRGLGDLVHRCGLDALAREDGDRRVHEPRPGAGALALAAGPTGKGGGHAGPPLTVKLKDLPIMGDLPEMSRAPRGASRSDGGGVAAPSMGPPVAEPHHGQAAAHQHSVEWSQLARQQTGDERGCEDRGSHLAHELPPESGVFHRLSSAVAG